MTPSRPARPIRKRAQDFNSAWASTFGVSISSRDPRTSRISTVTCRFCTTFGRENSRLKTAQIFKPPYRTDNFRQHLRRQHSDRWATYQAIESAAEREAFFNVEIPYCQTMTSHFGTGDDSISMEVIPSVVDLLKSLYLSNMEGVDSRIAPFIQRVNDEAYLVIVKKGTAFSIVIREIGSGNSFREVASTLRNYRQSCGLGFLDSVNDTQVGRYVQALTVFSLQAIANILTSPDVWCFSLALDGASHRGKSYIDFRIRTFVKGSLRNLHLLAVPFIGSHTGQNMYELLCNVLDAIAGTAWKTKLISVATDGAANMVGRARGVVSILERNVPNPIYRIWCGAHQLDLVVQDTVAKNMHGSFYQQLTSFISFLRRQNRFSTEVGGQCPRVATTRWLSLGRVSRWILRHREAIIGFFANEERAEAHIPPAVWWLRLYFVEALMEPTDICFKAVQGRDTLVEEQKKRFDDLLAELKATFGINATPESGVSLLSMAASGDVVSGDGNIMVTQVGLRHFFACTSSHCETLLDSLDSVAQTELMHELGGALIRFYSGVCGLSAYRDGGNSPHASQFPSVLPYHLKNATPAYLKSLVEFHRSRLLLTWKEHEIGYIEDDFRNFQRDERRGIVPRACFNQSLFNNGNVFNRSWSGVGQKYGHLLRFLSGLATVFPGTATVEADFSLIHQEVGEQRTSLTDLSLQGIMFAKQWEELGKIQRADVGK